MKRIVLLFSVLLIGEMLFAQQTYWVFFTDKANVTFDPYAYFDAKAIERRELNHISLYELSDYPLNDSYKAAIADLSEEVVGETRWFNAVAIVVDEASLEIIRSFPFVKEVELIDNDAVLASSSDENIMYEGEKAESLDELLEQVQRFNGELFVQNEIDGKGIRIAVFDGGFPGVDEHRAFAHLRNNNQILKTWNFPAGKEDVYGWNSHGTMVLSCIAGMENGKKMGLATGAEFLLARTEIGLEPAKEEVWWMQAVEWADKNGADVINSSLGYGKSRYNPKDMDGKKSLVSKAANMAAAKGMLVCNSMGNEGMDKAWRVLITPADADSVLSVGGIEPETNEHINFSSYGPTYDGRLKPNVSAFGTARVAHPKGGYTSASGTSFSSPLVAGFVACAWQTRPNMTAMEIKAEVEKSADHYPYFDYAYGYGVPQADYFLNVQKNSLASKTPSIQFVQDENSIYIVVHPDDLQKNVLLAHIQNSEGALEAYWQVEFIKQVPSAFAIDKNKFHQGDRLMVRFHDEVKTLSYEIEELAPWIPDKYDTRNFNYLLERAPAKNYKTSSFGPLAKYYIHPYLSWGFLLPPFEADQYDVNFGRSESLLFGIRFKGNVCKWYNLGANLEVGSTWFSVRGLDVPTITYNKEYVKITMLNLEFYQRFRIAPAEMFGMGLYFDAGIYGSWIFANKHFMMKEVNNIIYTETRKKLDFVEPFQWGVRARLGFEIIAIYAQYRLSNIFINKSDLPKPEVGIELSIPMSL